MSFHLIHSGRALTLPPARAGPAQTAENGPESCNWGQNNAQVMEPWSSPSSENAN